MFKGLSLESRNIQAQIYAPIQCTVWPRNDRFRRINHKKVFGRNSSIEKKKHLISINYKSKKLSFEQIMEICHHVCRLLENVPRNECTT